MKVFAVRIGDKYGQDIEDYINFKIPGVSWIRDEIDGMRLQWNKLRIMNMDIDEPVLVIDIDMLFINDYYEAINYPIERGEFLTAKSWWKDTSIDGYSLNGGFQKYYPRDCKYIYDEFMRNPNYWMNFFINNKTTIGEVNGEQFFVETFVRKKLNLKFIPVGWFYKYDERFETLDSYRYNAYLNSNHPDGWAYLGGEFNENIKIVHFMNADFNINTIKKYDKSYSI
jgi:hypothetical protein